MATPQRNPESLEFAPMLLLMRHAKSSWKNDQLSDHERPLNKRGRRAAQQMANFLQSRNISLTNIFSSSAVRAVETAQLVAEVFPESKLQINPRLYHANLETWQRVLSELTLAGDTLMIGHNPGMEEYLQCITGHLIRMPTAAIACLQPQTASPRPDLEEFSLVEVWRPKELEQA